MSIAVGSTANETVCPCNPATLPIHPENYSTLDRLSTNADGFFDGQSAVDTSEETFSILKNVPCFLHCKNIWGGGGKAMKGCVSNGTYLEGGKDNAVDGGEVHVPQKLRLLPQGHHSFGFDGSDNIGHLGPQTQKPCRYYSK